MIYTDYKHLSGSEAEKCVSSGWNDSDSASERQADVCALSVPDFGVYKVTVCQKGASAVFGHRRSAAALTKPKDEHEFLCCVTETIDAMAGGFNADKKLYAAAVGGEIVEMRAEEASARRIFIAGDSTVADQKNALAYYPFDSYCGWGQMLGQFLPNDAICNHAHSGLTARCFIQDGYLDIVEKYMRAGDLLLIQFGHNDQKRRALSADNEYPSWLSRIAEAAIKKACMPVLISPPARNAGTDTLLKHSQTVKALANMRGLPFIDLHSYSLHLYASLGNARSRLFKPSDITHTNDYGAYAFAKFIAECLHALGLADEIPQIADIKPDTDDALSPHVRKGGEIIVPFTDIENVPDKEIVKMAIKEGLLDPCVMHMHPFEPLSRAEFMHKLFRAAGLSATDAGGVCPYPDIAPDEFDAGMAKTCKEMRLITDICFRPDDFITGNEANDICARAGIKTIFRAGSDRLTRYEIVAALLDIK